MRDACIPLPSYFPATSWIRIRYPGNLWIKDPPGGKENPTTDPNWASLSVQTLNNLVEQNGPFDGIMGFSQGAAMLITYLSTPTGRNSFRFAIILSGYLPTTHLGLTERIDAASPISTPSLFYYGSKKGTV